ncbi:MAG: hypothetical protein JNK76_00035 [Planctomycetales bacterium]|nr:hypothetical protein [Planctomycetales bacterium]MBN8627536.1 hypothetical protein [Planctomycetota bacterium]
MNPPAGLQEFLVISRGQWDEIASKEDVQAAIDRFYPWYEEHLLRGTMKRGSRLGAEGKVVGKQSISDGPFAETKELVGGYWFIVAASLDEAAAIAAENPCLAYGLTLEIRPLDPERCEATAITNETPDAWRTS